MRETHYSCDYCGKAHSHFHDLTSFTVELSGHCVQFASSENVRGKHSHDFDCCTQECFHKVLEHFNKFVRLVKSGQGKD